ncbi:GGDEF domain-containing protein [Piscinibacter sp.]|uniref:GGDEF domain-containing protein n=1 Tax=Piscinibacter sp. TaxID=1903157 RepID=UPI001B594F35|nr:GGDEF domain-containing protein [Piscinibacter sp.]MBK7529353.1 diguanylate cyclase [Piscinibacter sp.]MBP6541604.1 diguanylate cyclase [Piscinibacter sp.]
MSTTESSRTTAARPGAETLPAQIAKAALRRLVLDKQELTPENYARAYAQESGEASPAAADGAALANLIGKLVRGVERGGRHWTSARRKDSLQRVLEGSRSDAKRLQQRLTQLAASWDADSPDAGVETEPAPLDALEAPAALAAEAAPSVSPISLNLSDERPWSRVVGTLGSTTRQALPPNDDAAAQLSQALAGLVERIGSEGASAPLAEELDTMCRRAGIVLQHRHHLVDQLGALCQELTASLTDLAEDDSWAKGQCEAMRVKLDEGLTARGVRAVNELLRDTRARQGALRSEREKAREALKSLINRMLSELGELGSQTGRFHESVGRYADVIEKADSLESLAGVVREMVEETRTVQALVQQTQGRLQEEHAKASELTARVGELEDELRRLSSEVSTDQLTQIANRRGLLQAFEAERARVERGAAGLAVGLLDIDNFKRLNDELGHAAGDVALRSLAEVVSKTLRPTDLVARYGGEEFVVLLPETPIDEGQQILTRLQRSLSGGLFMHEDKTIFVTFSAGVTDYRPGESIEAALERADQALYEAKRTGKNRTCIG